MSSFRSCSLVLLSCALLPTAGLAQDPDPPPVRAAADTLVVDTLAPDTLVVDSLLDVEPAGVSPGGAFLRAVLVPGWGHASIGSHRRGGVYLAAQSGTAYMLLRSRARRNDAQRVADIRELHARERLALEGVTDPLEVEAALEEDEEVQRARSLVNARSQQFEDWAALGIFLVLISGVDAFVSGHLKDFPTPVELEVRSLPEGRIDLGLRVPVGR